jgi:hypothetical protein
MIASATWITTASRSSMALATRTAISGVVWR